MSYAIYRNGRLYLLGLKSLPQARQYAASFQRDYNGVFSVEDEKGEEFYRIGPTTVRKVCHNEGRGTP